MRASGFVAHNVDIGPDEDGDIGRGTHWPRPQWVQPMLEKNEGSRAYLITTNEE